METQETTTKDFSQTFSKFAYGAFVALSLYFLIVSHSLSDFVMQFGIALVFDPFDQKVAWNERPFYQKAWFIVHTVILFGAFGWLLFA